ncbi:hypothetical protein F5Y19DRAFT_461619 [Xylariaceae sp. FL1651]|nr:hypothetical protein F5Y19DRAFT_461619 [Xylariaceae sp. FL1651]
MAYTEIEKLKSSTFNNEDDLLQSDSSSSPDVPSNASGSTQTPLSLPTDTQLTYLSFAQHTSTVVPLAQYWYCRGIPLLSERGKRWIYSKTDEDITSGRFQFFNCQSSPLPLARPLLSSHRELNWQQFFFFKSSFHLAFPVLDNIHFEETIKNAYECTTSMPSPPQALSMACVLAALSIFCRLEGSRAILPSADGDTYADKAQSLLGYVTGETSLVGLQTVLLLQRHQMSNGQGQNVTLLHAVACRIVCALGGHTYQPLVPYGDKISWEERQRHHLRMLFGLCYISDKDISLRSGQPPLLTKDYCDLTIPESCTSYCAHILEFGEATTYNKLHFHILGDPSLCCLKEKIYRLLFSPQAFRISDGDLVLRIRQLDDDLESWRLSIPWEFRPKLSISSAQVVLATEANFPQDVMSVHLQLEYHHLVTAIHTTLRRCGGDSPEHRDLPGDLHNVIHSSCDLSLEANRSTLTVLESCIGVLAEEEFSATVFYPTLAVVSLFIDILAHPRGAQAHVAIEDLLSAINIIQNLLISTPTEAELKQIQETTSFVRALIHLGRSDIAKAKREDTQIDNVSSNVSCLGLQ